MRKFRNIALFCPAILLAAFAGNIELAFAEPTTTGLAGRHYYFSEVGYQCTSMMGKKIRTFRDHIFFMEGQTCFAGDGCNDAIRCVADIPNGLQVSADQLSLKYQGHVYEYRAQLPRYEQEY